MSISFPNRSRSYDPTRRRVRFWGYDKALEITFFVEADALLHGDRAETAEARDDVRLARGEAAVLQAFDQCRTRVLEVASDVYERDRGFSHLLTVEDF